MTAKQNNETGYTVSQTTANFIYCFDALEDLYKQIYEAIETLYGSKQAESIMNDEVTPLTYDLKEYIGMQIFKSIDENLSMLENKRKII